MNVCLELRGRKSSYECSGPQLQETSLAGQPHRTLSTCILETQREETLAFAGYLLIPHDQVASLRMPLRQTPKGGPRLLYD